MNLWTVAAVVAGYFASRLANQLLGLEVLAEEIAAKVHAVTGRPHSLAGGAA